MEKIWTKHYAKGTPEEIDVNTYKNVPAIFTEAMDEFADRPAFNCMGKTITYRELKSSSRKFASYLQNQLGLKKGARVALMMPNILQYPIALFGVLEAGFVAVNVNPLYTARELQHQLIDAEVDCIIIFANAGHTLEKIIKNTPVKHVIVTQIGDQLGFPKSFIVNSVVKYLKKMVPPFKLAGALNFNDVLAQGDESKFQAAELKHEDIAFLQYTGGTTGVSKEKLPNIILVLLESVRSDHLSIYGYHRETTPFLKKIAQESTTYHFKYAYANSTRSYFSLISLTSGKDLRREQEHFEVTPLVWDFLKVHGYETSFITQSFSYPMYFLDSFLQTPGLDFYQDIGQESLKKYDQQDFGIFDWLKKNRLKGFYFPRDDQWTLDALKARLKALPMDKSFFAVWELECTHNPYCYSEDYKIFLPIKTSIPSRNNIDSFKNNYDNAILYSDHMIQSLFIFLKEEQLEDNTVVIITSDHGEAFYEHGQMFHGEGYYQEQSKVPFLIHIPERLKNNYSQATFDILKKNQEKSVQLIDIVPTILGLAIGNFPDAFQEQLDGHNLLKPLPPDREIFISNTPPSFMSRHQETAIHSIITSNLYQWIIHPDPGKNELYDLRQDPIQKFNLLEKDPEKYQNQIPRI